MNQKPEWRSIGGLAERLNSGSTRPVLSEHAIRHHVRQAQANGLAPHIRRIGRRIIVDETGFREWLNSHKGAHQI